MEKNGKIAVLGGGHGAHTMAADLVLKGFEVNMCETPEFEEGIKKTLERKAIDLIDAWGEKHTAKLNLVTTDFEEALKGVSYIMMAVPAIGSKKFFEAIMPYLEHGQTVIKWSGNKEGHYPCRGPHPSMGLPAGGARHSTDNGLGRQAPVGHFTGEEHRRGHKRCGENVSGCCRGKCSCHHIKQSESHCAPGRYCDERRLD
jgi:hypothetical protein